MKIMLAPGQKLQVGFYVPKDQLQPGGWNSSPEDHQLDGNFFIEFNETDITVSADEPDDKKRYGLLYFASFDSGEEDKPA